MSGFEPVTTIITFRLHPGSREPWLALWTQVQSRARATPSCHRFQLLCNRHDDAEWLAVSEWDSASDHDAFVREVGMIWLLRCMDTMCERSHYAFFQTVADEMSASPQGAGHPVSIP